MREAPDHGAAAVLDAVVGREREVQLILAAVNAGRDLLLEGPPGTSKTTLLKAITDAWDIPLVFAEGNAELTPARLLGSHDPSRVLTQGYSAETFEAGPLAEAMQTGGFLYFEEFNRAPEDTLNTLLTAIADRRISIPRVGTIEALPSFRLVGSMNPFDHVGTTRLSVSIKDRLNRLEITYQGADEEEAIVRLRGGTRIRGELGSRAIADAVAVTRLTRGWDGIAQGSSVRGAIDLALMTIELGAAREIGIDHEDDYRDAFWDTMLLALSGRISLDHAAEVSETQVLREIWEYHFILRHRIAARGDEPTELPDPGALGRREDDGDRARRPFKVKPKQLDADPRLTIGGNGAGPAGSGRQRDPGRRPELPQGKTSFGEESGSLDDEEGEQPGRDLEVCRTAAAIAARLALSDPVRRRRPRRGSQVTMDLPWSGDGGEISLDRTLEVLAEQRPFGPEEVLMRERRRTHRQVILAVDISGSMRGERLLTVAATVGALSAGLPRDELGVIAFWSDAAVLLRLGERAPLERLVGEILGLDAAGLTNISFPLDYARSELGTGGNAEQRVLLLSDCVHNAGPDPRAAAALLPRLDLLFDVTGERDSGLARDLARVGRGIVAPIRSHGQIVSALQRIFAS
jgi:MoxR-like ATPase